MATLTVSAPVVTLKAPTTWGSRSAIQGQLATIWKNYGKYIQFASRESGIDPKILTAFIAIESGGKYNAGSGNTIGLMQYNASYVNSQLKNEFLSNRLSENEKAKLSAYGFNFDAKGNTKQYTASDNLKPELNILIGSILLGQLADQPWGKDANGNLNLATMIVSYNSGMYSSSTKKAIASKSTSPKVVHDALAGNATTQSYLRKMFAPSGALDIASNELVNTIVA
jgi:hypothetical protein